MVLDDFIPTISNCRCDGLDYYIPPKLAMSQKDKQNKKLFTDKRFIFVQLKNISLTHRIVDYLRGELKNHFTC